MVEGSLPHGLTSAETSPSPVLEGQVERFDRWPPPKQAGRRGPSLSQTLTGVGLATIVVGLLLFILPLSPSRVPLAVLPTGLGAALEVLTVAGWLESRHTVSEVLISDTEVRFTSRNGRVRSASWGSRPVFVRLWHPIEQPPGTPIHGGTWGLLWGKIRADLSDEIARALVRRARGLGLRVTQESKEWPGWKGLPMIVEVVNLRNAPDRSSSNPT